VLVVHSEASTAPVSDAVATASYVTEFGKGREFFSCLGQCFDGCVVLDAVFYILIQVGDLFQPSDRVLESVRAETTAHNATTK